ncbi:MAG: hypothetical protein KDE28_24745 [Anaerolineales bacterium]|nr:hypothetical protein [Anaerolineales bacterium]
MNTEYKILASRIQQDLKDLAVIISRAERAIAALRNDQTDQDLFVDAAALNLHDLYSGIERIFEQIVKTVDGTVPTGRDWHRDLLQQVELDIPDIRPAAISAETAHLLDEFLRFRHVVRHNYAFELDPARIDRLVKLATSTFDRFQKELLDFVEFLKQVGQS